MSPGPAADGIAIVGMSGRFPGAATVEAFWANLRDGVESIRVFSAEELAAAGTPPEVSGLEGYVAAAGVIDGVDQFDARFFGFSPRDAEILDPQQRLFLECAWEALERAACNPDRFDGAIGVYAGTSLSLYAIRNLYPITGVPGGLDDFQVFLSNDKDHLATRTSYKLNLRGPSVTVQSACSTSLVAVCLACESLQAFQCDLALAGGVTIRIPQVQGYFYKEGGIGSPDGHCRTFDAAAKGTVGSSGVAVVALKRLADALADRDPIHAVLRGWALNNDGAAKVGYTAPSVSGQAAVVAAALALADVDPGSITYIEAHGTATPIGDPIEVAALTDVYGRRGLPPRSCAIGSLKSSVGHLDSAAGAASLIKTVLALEHQTLPASLHYESPNPEIDFESGPFYVNERTRPWLTNRLPRRAGVSAFGIGGTNAHVIVEEAPSPVVEPDLAGAEVLLLSSHSRTALDQMAKSLAQHLISHPSDRLADIAHTLRVGRKAFPHRRACRVLDRVTAVRCLTGLDHDRVRDHIVETATPELVFMFPGQGAQHVNMAADLYARFPLVADVIDRGATSIQDILGLDVRTLLFAAEGSDADEDRLTDTAVAQPALFLVEYALARLWMHWGVVPGALIGHSLGELVAACVAGVFTPDDAVRLIAARGRLMQAMPPGVMTAVALGADKTAALLGGHGQGLSIAAVNAPALTVVSGPPAAVEALEDALSQQGVIARRLKTSRAFHSPLMDAARAAFEAEVRRVPRKPPAIPIVSNVTGTWLTDAEAQDPAYWARQLREPVRFSEGLRRVRGDRSTILLEIGPGRTLGTLARQQPRATSRETILSALGDETGGDAAGPTETLTTLWLHGIDVDWPALYQDESYRKLSLPTYHFERAPFWIDGRLAALPTGPLGRQAIDDWFSLLTWVRQPVTGACAFPAASAERWLVLADDGTPGFALAERLRQAGHHVEVLASGHSPASDEADPRISNREYYDAALRSAEAPDGAPPRVLHTWSVTAGDATPPQRTLLTGFYSVNAVAQAVLDRYPGQPARVDIVSNAIYRVNGEEPIVPLKRAMVASCQGLAQEYPQLSCRVVDLDAAAGVRMSDSLDRLLAVLAGADGGNQVAIRWPHTWRPLVQPLSLPRAQERASLLRHGGVYLITGGLGRIGLTLASHLAGAWSAKVVLTGRTALPAREEWDAVLSAQPESALAQTLRALIGIDATGGGVLVVPADASDLTQMRHVIAETRARFGALHAVIHGAGLTTTDGFAMVGDVDVTVCERQLQPKVGGALVLEELLRGETLDFVMLLSSLSSVLVGLGFVPYAAANLVLDAIAESHTDPGTPWISVGWDGWDFTAGAGPASDVTSAEAAIRPAEGCDAFERILTSPMQPHVLVSTSDLQTRIRAWTHRAPPFGDSPVAESPVVLHTRPEIGTPFVAPTGDTQQCLAGMWQTLLGIERVGAHDNFFELGGHSLLAIQLASRIRETFRVDVTVRSLFDAPTVATLALLIAAAAPQASADDQRIVRVLDRVERLTDEEMRRLLDGQGHGFPGDAR